MELELFKNADGWNFGGSFIRVQLDKDSHQYSSSVQIDAEGESGVSNGTIKAWNEIVSIGAESIPIEKLM